MVPWFMWRGVILLIMDSCLTEWEELNGQILNDIENDTAIYVITSHLQILLYHMCSSKS